MRSRVAFVVGMVICALALPLAHGQTADALKKAQAAFDKAQLDYLQGKYDEAAQGFVDAFAARNFPQFLYNAGASYHMKGKQASDPEAYQKAVDAYKRYLQEDPRAGDKPQVEKVIGVLEAEIKRIKEQPPAGTGSASEGSGSAAAPAKPSQEVQQLGDVKPRGLIVIESDPSNATIYLDDKRKGPFATTPWSGTLEGDHKVIIEKRGFTVIEKPVSADPTKLFVLAAAMSQQSFLGCVDITSHARPHAAVAEHQARQAHVLDQRRWLRRVPPGGRGHPQRDPRDQGPAQGLAGRQAQHHRHGHRGCDDRRRRQGAVRARPLPQEPAAGRAHHHGHAA
ncbi:MAG: PEGA domain-containing protein [Deltaproteobacteria bacterium]|nr:MAG: PEGA domain-containing protein [Deltaproteobacteria bacterium]